MKFRAVLPPSQIAFLSCNQGGHCVIHKYHIQSNIPTRAKVLFFREKYLMVILRFNEDNTHDECCIDVVLKAGRYHEEQPCHVDGKHSEQEPGWNVDGAVVSSQEDCH